MMKCYVSTAPPSARGIYDTWSACSVEGGLGRLEPLANRAGEERRVAGRDVPILGVKWRPFVQFVYLPMWVSAPDPGVARAVFVGPSTAAVRDRGRRA